MYIYIYIYIYYISVYMLLCSAYTFINIFVEHSAYIVAFNVSCLCSLVPTLCGKRWSSLHGFQSHCMAGFFR